jgi:hypothetical protein
LFLIFLLIKKSMTTYT